MGFIQINQIATDIAKYRVIQTGAKIQSGGLYDGLINNEYHGSLKLIVAILPIADAEYVINSLKLYLSSN